MQSPGMLVHSERRLRGWWKVWKEATSSHTPAVGLEEIRVMPRPQKAEFRDRWAPCGPWNPGDSEAEASIPSILAPRPYPPPEDRAERVHIRVTSLMTTVTKTRKRRVKSPRHTTSKKHCHVRVTHTHTLGGLITNAPFACR